MTIGYSVNAPPAGRPGHGRQPLREPRVRVPDEVARLLPVECLGRDRCAGRLVDVSRTGVRIIADGTLGRGDRLSLVLPWSDGPATVIEAIVCWWRAGNGKPGEGGLQIRAESVRAWEGVLQSQVAPRVETPAAFVPPAPATGGPWTALVGPDPESTARLAARLGRVGLPTRIATPAAGGAEVARAAVVVAGPYRSEAEARRALAVLLDTPGLQAPLLVVLLPGADAAARRAIVEAGAFDCMSERDGGKALDLRLVAALRLSRERQEARAAVDRLVGLSGRDPLTGLANRRRFLALAANERRRARRTGEPLALLLLDVDHFKQVNDLYGHRTGDATLRALSRLLRRHLRPFDVIGRYGGEEFIVLLPGATQQGGLKAAERLRALIAATPVGANGIIRLTASVGVVSSEPPHAVPFTRLLASADRALYRAKHSGRNQVSPGVITTVQTGRPGEPPVAPPGRR